MSTVLEGTQPTDAVIEPEATETDTALADLEKALNGEEPAKPAAEPPKDAPGDKPAEDAPKEKTIDDLLGEIEEPKPADKPAEVQLSPDQKQILDTFQNPQEAAQALSLANSYMNFTGTMAKGDFASTEKMLESWNPEVAEGLKEYYYDKYVRNGDFVDRWIAEKEGRGEENKDVRALKGEVNKLKTQLESRKAEETNQQQTAQFQQTVQGFVAHVDSLLAKVGADDTDKQIIWSMVNAKVSADQNLKSKIHSRDYKAVNTVFKEAAKTYFTKNKVAVTTREVKQDAQAQHKPVVQAGTMQELSEQALPADIRQVPKGKEDAWLDQELGKLAKGRKK